MANAISQVTANSTVQYTPSFTSAKRTALPPADAVNQVRAGAAFQKTPNATSATTTTPSANTVNQVTAKPAVQITPQGTDNATKAKTTTPPTEDTVVLSETARAKLLEQDGLSLLDIAVRLGLSTSSVETDLGINSQGQSLTFAATA